jgi:hypothetical protein
MSTDTDRGRLRRLTPDPSGVGELKFGAVLFWQGFEFEDGGHSDKLLVVLGAKPGRNVICVLTTSKARGGQLPEGCHADKGYYFFRSGSYGWRKDTWVQLYRVVELTAADLLRASMSAGDLAVKRNLPTAVAAAIRNCIKGTKDISAAQIALLE